MTHGAETPVQVQNIAPHYSGGPQPLGRGPLPERTERINNLHNFVLPII